MNIRIKIDCENDAFDPCPWAEAARILHELADRIEDRHPDCLTLRDSNGNRVGHFVMED